MPLTYGFRSAQPRAQIFRNPWTGAVIATPVFDLSSNLGPQGYADRSGTGANGAPVGAPTNARGVFEDAIKFGGVRDTLNCGSNAPLDVAGDISVLLWTNAIVPAGSPVMISKDDGVSGWMMYTTAGGLVRAYFYVGATVVFGVSSILGKWSHVAMTVKSNICRVFADGLQENRAAVTMSDAAAAGLYVGSDRGAINWWPGAVELPQVWNGALSPAQVYANYLAAKDVPIYLDDFSSYAVTPVSKSAGAMCGPVRVLNNPMIITADTNGKKWLASAGAVNCYGVLTLNDTDAYGTLTHKFKRVAGQDHYFHWVNGATPGGAATNGYAIIITDSGTVRLYRMTGGALAAVVFNNALVTTPGVEYDCKLVRRVGGQFCLYMKGGAMPNWMLVGGPVTDNTHTTAGFLIPYLLANGATTDWTLLRVCERPASFPWEFSTGTYAGVVSGTTVWMRCLTAGVTFLPKDLDWQTCIFGLYKGADANVTDVLFVASEIGGSTFANQNGYVLRVAADESVQLIRTTGGVEAAPTAQTAAGYVAITTEYQIKITHNGTTNAYEFYIMGGAYTTWTLMFAATLGIHTSSNYHVTDLDADDRTTAPSFYTDLR